MKTLFNNQLNKILEFIKYQLHFKKTILTIFILSVMISCSHSSDKKTKLTPSQINGIMTTLGKSNQTTTTELDCASSYLDFTFNSSEKVLVSLPVKNGEEPYVGAKVEIYDSKNSLITSGVTDENGIYTDYVTIFDGQDLYAKVIAIGVPNDSFVIFSNSKNTVSTSSQVLNCQSSNKKDIRILTVGAYNNNGILATTQTNQTVSTKLLQAVNFAFPESQDIRKTHPEYIMTGVDTNIKLIGEADVWITFLHEGAGYRNSFGYFTYTDATKPTSPSQVNKIAVFPNASFKNSGGNLSSGDKVYLGRFSEGTRIGFWVISDGWDGSKIVESRNNIFSIPELNNETNPELKKHLAMLWYNDEQKIILGFEDLPRESGSCDHDFNDVVFTVTANPIQAISLENIVNLPGTVDSDGDGVADNNDPFPNDASRTYVRYYPGSDTYSSIAFEDLYPVKGDYDFNDMVVSFRIKEILDKNKNVKEFTGEYNLNAMGAANQNGLMLMVESSASNVESSQRTVNGAVKDNAIEDGHTGELVFKIIDNAKNQIAVPSGYSFANTVKGSPATTGDKIILNVVFKTSIQDSAPYNPFLYRVNKRSTEIHLVNKRPSSMFDTSLFNTGDDRSNTQNKIYFKDSSGYPWAMILGPDYKQPAETVSIKKAYPDFQNWVNSNGNSFKNWVTNKNLINIYN